MVNCFELLNLPSSFALESALLDRHFQAAHAKIHPDLWQSSLMKKQSETLSAQLNQAYQVLKNPLTRARHLLQLKGYWPVPAFPHLMEELFEFQENLPEREKLQAKQEEAFSALARAFETHDYLAAQQAYWWAQSMTHALSKV